jgi:DNA-binding XRE family transcriptional regulator
MIANIEKLRKNKGYNQDEIAKKLDIARQTYSKIES